MQILNLLKYSRKLKNSNLPIAVTTIHISMSGSYWPSGILDHHL